MDNTLLQRKVFRLQNLKNIIRAIPKNNILQQLVGSITTIKRRIKQLYFKELKGNRALNQITKIEITELQKQQIKDTQKTENNSRQQNIKKLQVKFKVSHKMIKNDSDETYIQLLIHYILLI
ncbi:unnamed protein product [Paramecium sonneborni]|uniref:Uncharacterized protein n=1 Tax=Paramecium sonneborni TaxID=65129 RepID=A0A8S1PV06_9CILI|nr:unnamed protein product [Paramecium sonneborni]